MRYWKRVDNDGKTTTVESYSHDLDIKGAIEIDSTEVNAYMALLPKPPPPPPAPHFSNPSFTLIDFPGVEQRLKNIESFLKALYS